MHYFFEWDAFYTLLVTKESYQCLRKKVVVFLTTMRLSVRIVLIIRFITFAFRLDLVKKNLHKRRYAFVAVSKCRVSKCRVSKCRVSKCRVSKCRWAFVAVSKCRVSKCRVSKGRVSKCRYDNCSLRHLLTWHLLTKFCWANVAWANVLVSNCHGTGGSQTNIYFL